MGRSHSYYNTFKTCFCDVIWEIALLYLILLYDTNAIYCLQTLLGIAYFIQPKPDSFFKELNVSSLMIRSWTVMKRNISSLKKKELLKCF